MTPEERLEQIKAIRRKRDEVVARHPHDAGREDLLTYNRQLDEMADGWLSKLHQLPQSRTAPI